jgi:hypothetical protein
MVGGRHDSSPGTGVRSHLAKGLHRRAVLTQTIARPAAWCALDSSTH